MKYKVCYVTSTRADYNPLKETILALNNCKDLDFKLIVTGTHLSSKFGNTYKEIIKDGIKKFDKVNIKLGNGTKSDMSLAIADTIKKFTEYFNNYKPDLLILCGDRFEIFGVAIAASILGIKIAHISGGDITEGAIDDVFRYSITQMSSLHFPGNDDSKKRIIQMGKDPKTVFNVGEPGIENILKIKKENSKQLSKKLNFDLTKNYAVVIYHPETLSRTNAEQDMKELITALDKINMNYLIIKSNADAGGLIINNIWQKESIKHSNWLYVSSLNVETYINCLRNAKMIIGNSSCGILEAPTVGIPTVNIGNRQKGRLLAKSVINCKCESQDITKAINNALKKKNTKYYLYGDGKTSSKIVKYILDYLNK